MFPPHACLSVVDRSVDARYEFKVGIPFEDHLGEPDAGAAELIYQAGENRLYRLK